MIELTQVVPSLPPRVSGVGDYAVLLAGELRRAHDVYSRFIVGDPKWSGPPDLGGFPVMKVPARTAESLVTMLLRASGDGTPVLLQYVGYGYEQRGCPRWLVEGLEVWRSGGGDPRLITMFHELYARRGPVWTSSFWNSHLQRRLAARLARITDRSWTNRNLLRVELGRLAPRHDGRVTVQPVFSNLGEPDSLPPLIQREPQAVLYGGVGRNVKGADSLSRAFGAALESLELERVVCFGRRANPLPRLRCPVVDAGVVSAGQITSTLKASRVGVLDYYQGELAKSGIFAAYCAHGMVPVLTAPDDSEADGLRAGSHFLVAPQLNTRLGIEHQQTVADSARAWYAGHTLSRTAAALIEDVAAPIRKEQGWAPDPAAPTQTGRRLRTPV